MSSRFRVVLVDDDEDLRFMWSELLRRSVGFEVVGHAADGLEALALCRDRRPDAVVTDCNMAELDGVRLARRLRSDHPEMIVVLCSSRPGTDLPPDLDDLGVTYLNKTHSTQLPALLAHLLRGRGRATPEGVGSGCIRRPST